MFLRFAAVGALGALVTSPVAAQQRPTLDPTRAVALAFARSISPFDSTGSVDLVDLVDGVPADLRPLTHLPAGAHVVATLVTRRGATVFATAPQPADTILRQIAREYAAAGWPGISTTIVAQPASMAGGGFRSAPPAFPRQFCHDGTEANPIAIPAGDGMMLVQLRILRNSPVCSRMTEVRAAAPQLRSPLPVLRDPEGAVRRSECFTFGATQRTQTQLATTMEPSALFDQYAKQMDAQGWTRMAESPAVRARWSRRDSTGVVEIATLSVGPMAAAPGCRDAQLEITTITGRP